MNSNKDISLEIEVPLLGSSTTNSFKENCPKQKKINQRSDQKYLFSKSFASEKYLKNVPFLKWITFLDILPDVKRINSSKVDLPLSDIPLPNGYYNIGAKIARLDDLWNMECEKGKPCFPWALLRTFLPEIFWSFGLDLIDCTTRLCCSLCLGKIINLITFNDFEDDAQKEELLETAIILSALILLSFLVNKWEFFLSYSSGAKVRLTIIGLLYKKLNSISLSSLQDFKVGKMINLMANDLNDIDNGVIYFPMMTFCLYQIMIGTFIMWGHFGASCLLGLAVSLSFLTLQVYLSHKTENLRRENRQLTDDRAKFTNEIIENIRLVKMYAWEQPFRDNIQNLRMKEDNTFRKIYFIDALGRNLSIICTYLSILLICMAYISAGGILSPDKIYASMMILGFISTGLMDFHKGRMFMVNFSQILQRVQEAMTISEVYTNQENNDRDLKERKGVITFNDFTAYWNEYEKKPCLSNITLTIKPGSLTTIIGKVGAGKSTFLLSLLKEIPVTSGSLSLSGKIAYVEQEPIIFSGTIRENILFGRDYNLTLYNKVLAACSLDKDMRVFSHGDLTLIGERGMNLSGGQKARLSLARAIYSESDIYLLDDPFSAVDSKVARDIFENALKGELLKDKTLILVTHHIHFARESDYVIVMNDGNIEAKGRFKEIERMNLDLINIFKSNEMRKDSMVLESEEKTKEQENIENVENTKAEEASSEECTSVSWSTYKKYMSTIGTYQDLFIFTALFCVNQALIIYYTRFIGAWALQHVTFYHDQNSLKAGDFDHAYYIKRSWILLIFIFILTFLKRVKFVSFILSTNSVLQARMLDSLIKARVLFFDINPIGRVLNRFSNDIGILDKQNISNAYDLIDGLFSNLALLLTVCFINPIAFILSGFVIYLLFQIRQFFSKPTIFLKKLELNSRSPIFSSISSTLAGLIVIRVYNQGERFIHSFFDLIYNNSRALLFLLKSSRLFAILLDAVLRLLIIGGIMTFTWLVFHYEIDSALVGLSLLFLLQLTEETEFSIRQTLYVDVNMQSAQRMLEYCHLESEAPQKIRSHDELVEAQFQGKWPIRGDIVFDNVYFKYRSELNYALNGLSFKIKGGDKVACVGRTGAGKSSLIQALFRMVEIENDSEHYNSYIKIDGVDIKTIGLNLLRRRLSIIPQTPVVFTGTIRRNLDPFQERSDQEIWQVLMEVSLKEKIMNLENRLDTDMTISSSVFSVGQKQLICLARAILMKSKVLILDEATANVDIETDEFIQKKIMEKFADCTVLTIAHRLITIANYDKVIVMDRGQMVEYDSPYILLVNNVGDDRITRIDGIFVDMVKKTGQSMSKKIFKVAKEHYFNKDKMRDF